MREKIEALNEKISLNQQSYLADCAKRSLPGIDYGVVFSMAEFLTERKYKHLLALYFNGRKFKWAAEAFREELTKLVNTFGGQTNGQS